MTESVVSPALLLPDASPIGAGWHDVDWRKVTKQVRRLQTRIVKAEKQGKRRQVRNLQRLLTHSIAAKLLAVRRVTQNRGKRTAGVDGQVWTTPQSKWNAALSLVHKGYKAKPLRRVLIPKSNGSKRPLGIPTMKDRAMQALHLFALDPVAETRADRHSFGFRRGRSAQDAKKILRNGLCRGFDPQWILEGDIKACFDNISHPWLEANVPMDRGILRKWLRAGVLQGEAFSPTERGTPQGGIISPVLANLALDGLQDALIERFAADLTQRRRNRMRFVRYADDFVIAGISREFLEQEVKPFVNGFLCQREMELSETKTTITHIEKGFDFLEFNFRKYPNGKVLIKPTRKAVKTLRAKFNTLLRRMAGAQPGDLVRRLNPLIRGWFNYYRHSNVKQMLARLGRWFWLRLLRWAKRRHSNKSTGWVVNKYFHDTTSRGGSYRTFGGPTSDGQMAYLFLPSLHRVFEWSAIKTTANPYDPAWEMYFEKRHAQHWVKGSQRSRLVKLFTAQRGLCAACNQPITEESGWDVHHIHPRVLGGSEQMSNLLLVHPCCHRQFHARYGYICWVPPWWCVLKA